MTNTRNAELIVLLLLMTNKIYMDAKYVCGSKFSIGTNYKGILTTYLLKNDPLHTMKGQNMNSM